LLWRIMGRLLRRLGRGALLVPVAAMGMALAGVHIWTVALVLIALVVAFRKPLLAAALLPLSMVSAGLAGLVAAALPPGRPAGVVRQGGPGQAAGLVRLARQARNARAFGKGGFSGQLGGRRGWASPMAPVGAPGGAPGEDGHAGPGVAREAHGATACGPRDRDGRYY